MGADPVSCSPGARVHFPSKKKERGSSVCPNYVRLLPTLVLHKAAPPPPVCLYGTVRNYVRRPIYCRLYFASKGTYALFFLILNNNSSPNLLSPLQRPISRIIWNFFVVLLICNSSRSLFTAVLLVLYRLVAYFISFIIILSVSKRFCLPTVPVSYALFRRLIGRSCLPSLLVTQFMNSEFFFCVFADRLVTLTVRQGIPVLCFSVN